MTKRNISIIATNKPIFRFGAVGAAIFAACLAKPSFVCNLGTYIQTGNTTVTQVDKVHVELDTQ